MSTVFLTANLVFSTRAEDAASRAGRPLCVVASPESALEACQEREIELVVLDLSCPALDVRRLVTQLQDLPVRPQRILAFGPHVHAARLAEARQAGCDDVLTRRQFHNRLEKMFAP